MSLFDFNDIDFITPRAGRSVSFSVRPHVCVFVSVRAYALAEQEALLMQRNRASTLSVEIV